MKEQAVDDSQIEVLREMVRGAAPGSVLAVAPDVFDRYGGELAVVVGGTTGHSMTITRSTAMKPGMVAVISQHGGTPISNSPFGRYMGGWAKPVREEPGVEIEAAAAPKPPRPPRPRPPAAPQPSMPPPPGPPRPRGPRQRIVDT
jgi:hypothetical protein